MIEREKVKLERKTMLVLNIVKVIGEIVSLLNYVKRIVSLWGLVEGSSLDGSTCVYRGGEILKMNYYR